MAIDPTSHVEPLDRPPAGRLGQRRTPRGHVAHCGHQRVDVRRLVDIPAIGAANADARLLSDELRHAARARIDHRQTGRHRLEDHGRARILVLGVKQDVGLPENRRRFVLRVRSEQLDPIEVQGLSAATSAWATCGSAQRRRPVTRRRTDGSTLATAATTRSAVNTRYAAFCVPASRSVSPLASAAIAGLKRSVSTGL